MRLNPIGPWELQIGILRVYYDVEETPEPVVFVLTIGVKERHQVHIGKETVRS